MIESLTRSSTTGAPEIDPMILFSLYSDSLLSTMDPPTRQARQTMLASELEVGGRYRVVVTTGGGLYRYRLLDEVRVEGFLNTCPLLRFLGKSDRTSDLVGEKLSEPHVRSAIERACTTLDVRLDFALLVPEAGQPPRYRLYAQRRGLLPTDEVLGRPAEALQGNLQENPHYRYAVNLGQLAPRQIHWLGENAADGYATYQRAGVARGQSLGNIKPTALDTATDWNEWFGEAVLRATAGRLRHGRQ